MLVFTARQQLEVESAFDKHPDACIVYIPWLIGFARMWDPTLVTRPLPQYIYRHFKVIGATDGYYFLARKERDLSIPSGY